MIIKKRDRHIHKNQTKLKIGNKELERKEEEDKAKSTLQTIKRDREEIP